MSLEDGLIRLAVTGDREAQRLLYESLKDSIGRLVSRVVETSDVDDVTQDIFLHVFCSLGSFRFESEFTTWVYRLAVNDAPAASSSQTPSASGAAGECRNARKESTE